MNLSNLITFIILGVFWYLLAVYVNGGFTGMGIDGKIFQILFWFISFAIYIFFKKDIKEHLNK